MKKTLSLRQFLSAFEELQEEVCLVLLTSFVQAQIVFKFNFFYVRRAIRGTRCTFYQRQFKVVFILRSKPLCDYYTYKRAGQSDDATIKSLLISPTGLAVCVSQPRSSHHNMD
jgi:hypothetical protein